MRFVAFGKLLVTSLQGLHHFEVTPLASMPLIFLVQLLLLQTKPLVPRLQSLLFAALHLKPLSLRNHRAYIFIRSFSSGKFMTTFSPNVSTVTSPVSIAFCCFANSVASNWSAPSPPSPSKSASSFCLLRCRLDRPQF